jgi:hypothetical protein
LNSFNIPPSLVDLTDRPPVLQTSEPGSFARYTLEVRVPGILKETLALNAFPDDIRAALEDLHVELIGGVIRELREEAPDRAFWNAVSSPYFGRSWLDVPWYWAEAYFYRRLLEATRYFQPGPWKGLDPFGPKWDFLRTKRRRLAILADNAGTELLMDLALVDYLLGQELVAEVHLHLKPQPFFVSDAMPQDVIAGLRSLEKAGDAAGALGQRLRAHLAAGRLHVFTHWQYATSLFFFQLPDALRDVLAGMDLVLVKGDANYRRLLGDAHWPPTTPFARATRYFPAPLVALRTLKAWRWPWRRTFL